MKAAVKTCFGVYRSDIVGIFFKRDTHTYPFNGPFSVTTQVGQYQKGKTNLDFNDQSIISLLTHDKTHMLARDSK